MLEKYTKTLQECNKKRLEQQCENEDMAKDLLFFATNKTEEEQNERRKFLNKRIEQRKNLYIYPAKSNA